MIERFYSGQQNGQVVVRDSADGGKRTLLGPRSVLFSHGEKGFTRTGDDSGTKEIALTLLRDALGNEKRASERHEHFSRRVVALFPDRWTISRSRVLSYLSMIELERRLGMTSGW